MDKREEKKSQRGGAKGREGVQKSARVAAEFPGCGAAITVVDAQIINERLSGRTIDLAGIARSVWSARGLPPLGNDPERRICSAPFRHSSASHVTAPASWTHSRRFAREQRSHRGLCLIDSACWESGALRSCGHAIHSPETAARIQPQAGG